MVLARMIDQSQARCVELTTWENKDGQTVAFKVAKSRVAYYRADCPESILGIISKKYGAFCCNGLSQGAFNKRLAQFTPLVPRRVEAAVAV